MGFILGAFKVIILLGILVLIHEFGHFIVAKACKVKVLKFSIGFGPKILKKQCKETEYSIRALPLGGFVQLEGEEEDSKDPRSFNQKPAWQRCLILLAGVVMNITFALLIYFLISFQNNVYMTTKITSFKGSETTNLYGLTIGDEIDKINGERVYNSYDISEILSNAKEDTFLLEVIHENGEKETISATIQKEPIGYIGVSFANKVIDSVAEGSAGEVAGLKEQDELLAINGQTKETIEEYLAMIQSSPKQPITMQVKRNAETLAIEVIPERIEKRDLKADYEIVYSLPFGQNFSYALRQTNYYLKANIQGFLELFTGKAENVEVQGIVGISKQISQTQDAFNFFYLMSAISFSLGIMNLLPIPGLDGGKLLFTLIEMVRRKPISKEVEGTLTLAGLGILVLLMIVVTVKDVIHLF